jgi:aspartyl-tRNA(Asn)/glutamyl-tRNA(Gln) amidotransferase subunit A
LGRVSAVEPDVAALLTVTEERAREQALAVDDRLASGEALSVVSGIPLVLKDVLATRGIRTTAGSKILEPYVPPYDCTPWARLQAAGSVLVGKTNCDEFAMGSSNENSAYGPVHNPWGPDRVPGGSSGGSAAAVAAGEAVWGLGTDTGGSVRQPASLCGIVGMKGTYGRVSRHGLIAFASSLDHVGTFSRNVRDAATLFSAIAGHDPLDATSLPEPSVDHTRGLDQGIEGLRVGVVEEWLSMDGVQPGVRDAVRAAVDRLAGLGASVDGAELPHADYALSAYYLIAPAECSSNLARFDGVRYGFRSDGEARDVVDMNMRTRGQGFGDEVKRRIMLGTYALSAGYYDAYYGQAQKVRTLVIRDYDMAFRRFDLLVGPTSPTTAFRLGEKTADPLAMYLSDIFTIPSNLSGTPAISIPCGLADGLPVGFQLMGRLMDEATVFRAAYALERELGFSARPALVEDLAA